VCVCMCVARVSYFFVTGYLHVCLCFFLFLFFLLGNPNYKPVELLEMYLKHRQARYSKKQHKTQTNK
jgi:hypothetical protein